MSTPRAHAEIIKAWADGAEIQYRHLPSDHWYSTPDPAWTSDCEYRIKPREHVITVSDGRATFEDGTNTNLHDFMRMPRAYQIEIINKLITG